MNDEQLNKLLSDLAVLDEDEQQAEEAIALFIAGKASPDVKAQVEARMAEDAGFRAEIQLLQREAAKLTPARLARLEERILDNQDFVPSPGPAPLPEFAGAISKALAEAVADFKRLASFLQGPILQCHTSEREHRSADKSAVALVKPVENGIEIEVVSGNPEDAGARIEAFVQPGDWRAELVLVKYRGSPMVRGSLTLTAAELRQLPQNAEIHLRAIL